MPPSQLGIPIHMGNLSISLQQKEQLTQFFCRLCSAECSILSSVEHKNFLPRSEEGGFILPLLHKPDKGML